MKRKLLYSQRIFKEELLQQKHTLTQTISMLIVRWFYDFMWENKEENYWTNLFIKEFPCKMALKKLSNIILNWIWTWWLSISWIDAYAPDSDFKFKLTSNNFNQKIQTIEYFYEKWKLRKHFRHFEIHFKILHTFKY